MIKVASGASGMSDNLLTFAEAMMKDGGRMQALSFHYYTVPSAVCRAPRGPATGFSRRAVGIHPGVWRGTWTSIVSQGQRDHGQV